MLEKNMNISKTYIVKESMSAINVKSGGLEVLATPEIVRLVEALCFNLVESELDENTTTVGALFEINHLRPTKIDDEFLIDVTLENIGDRKLSFSFFALSNQKEIANGKHIRYIVNKQKFMEKLG